MNFFIYALILLNHFIKLIIQNLNAISGVTFTSLSLHKFYSIILKNWWFQSWMLYLVWLNHVKRIDDSKLECYL